MKRSKIDSRLTPTCTSVFQIHRDQKNIGGVSFWPAKYRNRPPKVPLIFNFKNFGDFQNFLNSQEMHYFDFFCFIQLKQHWIHIIIYKYTFG
jgi:hypothetical protein